MKCRCPHCGHAANLIDFTNEESARQAVFLVAGLPRNYGQLALRYIGLFKPASRSLSWDRTLKLLKELKADIDAKQIERHGRIWHVPDENWQQGFETMINKAATDGLKLPLKNHAYLYEILSSKQSSAEAKTEQETEVKRQQAQHRKEQKPKEPENLTSKAEGAKQLKEIMKNSNIRKRNGDKA